MEKPDPGSPPVSEDLLHEVVATLADLHRPAGSPGERQAATWIAERLMKADCDEVTIDDEPTWGGFPPTITALAAMSTIGAAKVMRGRRRGALLSLAAGAGLLDEIQNGPRLLRRTVRAERRTTNVIATIGPRHPSKTLVMLAHHDAAQTGKVFDQTWARALHSIAPDLMHRAKKQMPQWWIGFAPGVLAAVSALTGWKRPARWGVGLGLLGLVAVADILRSPTVPGANDNLSGVAALIGLAESLHERPIDELRVVLVSCGAEETLQDGIRAFMKRHGDEFGLGKTWFLNFDTVGSSELVMLEGEGPAWMEDYSDPSFRDLIASAADGAGVPLERGVRARASTDSVIPSRAGHPTATVVSLMPWRVPGNYHLMSDTAENVDYSSVANAVRLARSVAEKLAR